MLELYGRVVDSWARNYNSDAHPALVSSVLRLLLASRRGLSETELQELVPITDHASWSALYVTPRRGPPA